MSSDDGWDAAREQLRVLLDSSAPETRRKVALEVGELSLELAHDGDSELARSLGMSLTLLSATSAHVASLEHELMHVREALEHHERQADELTERGVAIVRELVERVERLEAACPGLGGET